MAQRPHVRIAARELPASPIGHSSRRVWDLWLEYPGGFQFRYKNPASTEERAEALRRRFQRKLQRGETPDLSSHWIGLPEEIVGRLTARPILRISRSWQPGLNVIPEGLSSPKQQAGRSSGEYRLILVGPAAIYQHPTVFPSRDDAESTRERVEGELEGGRDLVGSDWEVTDLFPKGRTIVYLPSVKVQKTTSNPSAARFRYNYFISDADRFPAVRCIQQGAEVRLSAISTSFQGRLQWKVNSMEHLRGIKTKS